jgi:hypothetical protein
VRTIHGLSGANSKERPRPNAPRPGPWCRIRRLLSRHRRGCWRCCCTAGRGRPVWSDTTWWCKPRPRNRTHRNRPRPRAVAQAEITDTPEGTRIAISVSDLPPAALGTYYQAWLRKHAQIGVSAGTFHLRDGDGPIELWAGVSTDDYPLLTVTLQQEAQTKSSGQVVLKALIGGGP